MKYIKACALVILLILIGKNVFAEEITKNDVVWSWGTIEKNLATNIGQRAFELECEKDANIQEYLSRCNVTKSAYASEKANEAIDMLKLVVKNVDGREVLSLNSLLDIMQAKDIKNMLLAKSIINNYESIFNSDDNGTSNMISKTQFEKLIKEKKLNDEEANGWRESFAKMYYVQTEVNKDKNKKIIEGWTSQQGSANKQYTILDSSVYALIEKNGINIKKAKKYEELADTASINTASEYEPIYVYVYALATLSEEQVDKYINSFVSIQEEIDNADKVWNDKYSEKSYIEIVTNQMEYEPIYCSNMKWRFSLKLNEPTLNSVKNSIDQDIVIESIADTTYNNNTKLEAIVSDVVSGKLHFSSFLYNTAGFEGNEYVLDENGYFSGKNSTSSKKTIKQLIDQLADRQNIMHRYTTDLESKSFYFCQNDASADLYYYLHLPKFKYAGNRSNALGWFHYLIDEDYIGTTYTINDIGVVALSGEYNENTKTFTYDVESKNMYFLKINEAGSTAELFRDLEQNGRGATKTYYLPDDSSKVLQVNEVIIKQRVNRVFINFSSYDKMEYEKYLFSEESGSSDLYYKLENSQEVKDTKVIIADLTAFIKEKVDYSAITKEQLEIKLNELLADEGIDYSELDYCPDQLDVRPICKDGWWTCAWKFLNEGKESEHKFATASGVNSAITEIEDLIFDIGNIIFILVTAFLGVKYIWGGVDSKFSVKNSLVTLVVAAIVFYGWDAVTNILDVKTLLTGTEAAAGHVSMANVVYNTIMYIINIAAVGGIIYIGIKYMMAGAEGKSELKLKGIPIVMGIVMVYGTLNLINFILKIVEGL